MDPIIEVKDLQHIYPSGTHALCGINLSIYKGEFVALIGQNGSGKTTFAKHLNGLLHPTKGSVYVDGKDVSKHRVSEMAHTVGYCFQNPDHQIFCDTVEDEAAYGPKNLGLNKEEIEERVVEALGAVGLMHLKKQSPRYLSRGQRQRVAVAAVISMRPQVMIIDEPTTGQDYRDGLEMLQLIETLNKAGHTVLFITHDMAMVAHFARRTIAFRDGRILLDGDTRSVFSHPEILKGSFLTPPQISVLAQAMPDLFKVTPLTVQEMIEHTLGLLMNEHKE
jgi:energy-coupling factor transport system ATP-binding protein